MAIQKCESVKETRQKLELALHRLVNGNPKIVKNGTKISATSVSKEAEVNRTTLYNYHEPVLIEIRRINDAAPKALLKESRSEVSKAAAKMKEYRQLVEEAQEEVAALARINYRLDARISELEALIRVRDGIIKGFKEQSNERDSKAKIVPFFDNTPH